MSLRIVSYCRCMHKEAKRKVSTLTLAFPKCGVLDFVTLIFFVRNFTHIYMAVTSRDTGIYVYNTASHMCHAMREPYNNCFGDKCVTLLAR